MVEPTESEPKHELDRFCDAMISIHAEIGAVANGKVDRENNVLKNAPHTARQIASEKWDRPYSREQAAFPAAWTHEHKFWPAVARVDNVMAIEISSLPSASRRICVVVICQRRKGAAAILTFRRKLGAATTRVGTRRNPVPLFPQ